MNLADAEELAALDLTNHDTLWQLLDKARNEPNDLERGLARATLEGNALSIIYNLLSYNW